jgi:hypothetical protein
MDALADRAVVPHLWGAWRSWTPDFYTAWCPSCGAELWVGWSAGRWRVSCAGGCPPEDIEAGTQRLLARRREREQDEREAVGALDPDDPLYGITAEQYIEALTGREVDRHGFAQCPFHADGRERTPSLHATGVFWFCQACQKGGSIYDYGAELWGITPRREGFIELRERLVQELLQWA